MIDKKILSGWDVCFLGAVILIYGCTSKGNTVDWSAINYSKFACSNQDGEQQEKCNAMKKDMSTVTVGGKR